MAARKTTAEPVEAITTEPVTTAPASDDIAEAVVVSPSGVRTTVPSAILGALIESGYTRA